MESAANRPRLPSFGHSGFPRNIYFFCEKSTGATHFQLGANSEGNLPTDEAAGLLAMHCVLRGRLPTDYVILVQAPESSIQGLSEKASTLLKAGRMIHQRIPLTRRETEVLSGLMRCHSNKEIGASLKVCERTVKFHVSAMLNKFRVKSRLELVSEASRHYAAHAMLDVPRRFDEQLSNERGLGPDTKMGRLEEISPASRTADE